MIETDRIGYGEAGILKQTELGMEIEKERL